MAPHPTYGDHTRSETNARHLRGTPGRGPLHVHMPKIDPAPPVTRAWSQKRSDYGDGSCRRKTCRGAGCPAACPTLQALRYFGDSECCRWQTHAPGEKSRCHGVQPRRQGCGEMRARAHHDGYMPVMETEAPTQTDQVPATNAADRWKGTSVRTHHPQKQVWPSPHHRPDLPHTRRLASATCCPHPGCTLQRSHPQAPRRPRLGHNQHKCYRTQLQSNPPGGRTVMENSTLQRVRLKMPCQPSQARQCPCLDLRAQQQLLPQVFLSRQVVMLRGWKMEVGAQVVAG